MRRKRISPLILGLCVLGRAFGQAPALTIEQAVSEALEHNLGLIAERYNLSVAEARIIQARLRPNPVLTAGADYQDWLGTGFNVVNAAGPSEVNLRTDFVLERGGKRDLRIALAKAQRDVAQLQLLDATRQLVLRVEAAFVEVLLAKENLLLARENLAVFERIVEVNAARVKAGDLARIELIRTELAALQFRNAVRQAELRWQTARNLLRLLLGRRAISVDFDVAGPFRRDFSNLDLAELQNEALRLRPDLEALRRDQARTVADLRLQLAQGIVDYTFGVQYHRQYDNAKGNSLGLFFSAPLPVFNRNQGEIERARAEQRQAEARIRALEQSIRNEVESAYAEYLTARDVLETIERDMVSQAHKVRETAEYSYRRGEASFVEFLDAQRAFNDTMQAYNEARAEYAKVLYLLDSITGKSVNP